MSKKITNEEPGQDFLELHDPWVAVKNSAIESLEDMSIDTALNNIIEKANTQLEGFLSIYDIGDRLDEIETQILTLEISDQTIIDYSFSLAGFDRSIKREERIEAALHLTLIYISMALITNEDGRLFMTWRAISKAEYYLGLSIGLINYSALAKSERSETGIEQRRKNKLRINQVTLNAIKKHRPKKGWRSVFLAVDDIVDTVQSIAAEENLPLPKNRNDLIYKLRNIISEESELSEAIGE